MLQLEMQLIFYVKTFVDSCRVDRNKQTVYDYFVGNCLLGERCREGVVPLNGVHTAAFELRIYTARTTTYCTTVVAFTA